MAAFIQLENVSFAYPANRPGDRPTLADLNLSIGQGEFVALIGANGSGKSTLAKLLNALLLPDTGTVVAAGLDTRISANHPAIRAGIGMVFQRPQDQTVAMTVEEDAAFGPANLGLPFQQIRWRVDQALDETGLAGMRERPPYLLSAGETQRLALAGVLAMRPQCVIFDETTAMLDPAGREMVLRQAHTLQEQGITVILITHLMQEAAAADRVIVLREGRLYMDASPAAVFARDTELRAVGLDIPDAMKIARRLLTYMPALPTGLLLPEQLLDALPPFPGKPVHSPARSMDKQSSGHPLIDIRDLSHTYMQGSPLSHLALDELSLQVAEGSLHGLIGGTGSGKSTLLQHINGLLLPQSGTVRVGSFQLQDEQPDLQALRRRVALAFQQPEDQIFEQYVGDEVAYGPRMLGYEGKLADVVRQAMEKVGLDFEAYKDRLTSSLSGGEKRKVALASVLAVGAEILLLDEPLAGLDPQSAHELVRQLKEINQAGTTLLISTHQYDELVEILDHVSVIHRGKDRLHGSDHAFSQVEELEALGLQAPLAARAAAALRSKGWPLPPGITTLAYLEESLELLSGRRADEPV